MKRLFIKIFQLVACVVIIIVVYGNIVWEKRKIDTLRKDARILVLGDSHLECGLIDDNYPIFENRCYSGEPYILNYYKLRSIKKNNDTDHIDAICLVYSYISIAKYRDSIFVSNESKQYIDNYAPALVDYNNLPSKYGVPFNSQYILPIRARLPNLEHFSLTSWKGGYRHHTVSNIDPSSDLLSKQIEHHQYKYCDSGLDNYISTIQINFLKHIASYSNDLNIPLFLVNTPQHRDYNNVVPETIKEFHSKLAQELSANYATIYLDYHDMELPDSCFRDYDHLNDNGANIFTPTLLKDITLLLNAK